MSLNFKVDPIRECIRNFGSAPRTFSLRERLTYLRVPKPFWLYIPPSDELWTLFNNLPRLLANGKVVWGHVVQANCALFEPGKRNAPGEIVYSLDEDIPLLQLHLQQLAVELLTLKGTKQDHPELLHISEYLADELIRVFGLPVPRSVSLNHRFQISTTLFVRKHLPQRQIGRTMLPVIVNPNEPHVVLPLPERFWPEELVQWWTEPEYCFSEAVDRFSDHQQVSQLVENYYETRRAIITHRNQHEVETANFHREQQVQILSELVTLLDQLWLEQRA